LHTFGLLNNSFRPPEEICALRAYWRQRAEHVASASTCIPRTQKVLTEMNVQLANVISDISGLTASPWPVSEEFPCCRQFRPGASTSAWVADWRIEHPKSCTDSKDARIESR
jgi:hypothetical protein